MPFFFCTFTWNKMYHAEPTYLHYILNAVKSVTVVTFCVFNGHKNLI